MTGHPLHLIRAAVRPALGAAAIVLVSSACGSPTAGSAGTAPAPATVTSPRTPVATLPTSPDSPRAPTATPTSWNADPTGDEPDLTGRPRSFPAPDYHYDLTIDRFGPLGGVPLLVTVRDGAATRVQFRTPNPGGEKPWAAGDDIPTLDYGAVTLQDVIDAAYREDQNPPQVRWPAGQGYPDYVSVDPWPNAIDDEYTYRVGTVVID